MSDSIFTKIIKGEIPSHKIYEDDRTYAFLDINPITHGHTLVISKAQVEFVWDLSAEDYAAVMKTAKKVARHLREKMGKKYIGEQIIGEAVPHAHVHLIPFNDVSEYRHIPPADHEPDHEALAALAEKLQF